MVLKRIEDLPYRKEQAIIINVGTKLSTTLAIISALKYIDMPLLVVNCPIKNDGLTIDDNEYLVNLQSKFNFDLLNLPLKKHGLTLDLLFSKSKAEYILLIDSDVEVLNDKCIEFMRSYVEFPKVFGSGFVHGPHYQVLNKRNSYYGERMWIPFTYLNVKIIQDALNENQSFFNIISKYNDFPSNQYISKIIYKIENKFNLNLKILNVFRKRYGNRKPSFALYDTGSTLYNYLKDVKGYSYVGPSAIVYNLFVNHFDGITRNILDSSDFTGQSLIEVSDFIKKRLNEKYFFEFK